jgi:hypothetical protein
LPAGVPEVIGPGDCCAADSARAIAQAQAAAAAAGGRSLLRGSAGRQRQRTAGRGLVDPQAAMRHDLGDRLDREIL